MLHICIPPSSSRFVSFLIFLDEIIGKVSDALSGHFPDYVALLTADMPRDVSVNSIAIAIG